MSEQNRTNVSTKPRRGRQTKQSTHANTMQHPANDDKEAWKVYWKEQGQPWRTEPEIDRERQLYLEKRRNDIKPDEKEGIYPFSGIKLNRADVEWLLATHEHGRGPVDWSDESQRERKGLDIRGANLSDENLSELPLAKLRWGIIDTEFIDSPKVKKSLEDIPIQAPYIMGEQPEGVKLYKAQLQEAELYQVQLQRADLSEAQLQGAILIGAQLQGAFLMAAQLQGACLFEAQLQRAILVGSRLQGASLSKVQLQKAYLDDALLQGAILSEAQLQGADLRDIALADAQDDGTKLADIQWGDTNLAVVDWSQITILGDEFEALKKLDDNGKEKDKDKHLGDYKAAVRAYRQLSMVLSNQGLNEDAARFAFRAQRMQRKALWLQGKYGQYLLSGFINLLAGYGYRFWRSFLAYAVVIAVFAAIYYHISPHISWYESIVISMTAFHGRGFFPTQFNPGDPQAIAAAIEAFIGLFIEITLIATLTQRLFGK
ncbi:MAG TPA: pentapeptide repeat-containing protein [Ktedonobacteraceae bacterium]